MPIVDVEIKEEVKLRGEVEIEVYCSCGKGLCSQSVGGSKRGIPNITVEPCLECLEVARKEGYNEGYDEGGRNGRNYNK